jgi:hypothetical protein
MKTVKLSKVTMVRHNSGVLRAVWNCIQKSKIIPSTRKAPLMQMKHEYFWAYSVKTMSPLRTVSRYEKLFRFFIYIAYFCFQLFLFVYLFIYSLFNDAFSVTKTM